MIRVFGDRRRISRVLFSSTSNFGFEPGAVVTASADGVASVQPFYFSARLPAEGNFRVTLTFPGGTDATITPVRPPMVKVTMKPTTYSIGTAKRGRPSHIVASQQKICSPVGIDTDMLAAV